MKAFIERYQTQIILFTLTFLSCFSLIYFIQQQQILLYGDALSRMNISRKIVDNLTPGLAQLGNVWLPLPQMAMLMFTWNFMLWQTGLAGAFVSMASFITGGIFLYKSAKIITSSVAASLFALGIYALNINLLYLQTTAMSESIFLCSVIITLYFFIQWIKEGNKREHLLYAGIAMSAATLIRYEALALLLSSIPMVYGYLWYKTGKRLKAEGYTIMYIMLACLGFAMWTLYLAVIFGDPLYWKNYYADTKVVIETSEGVVKSYTFGINLFEAFWKYFTSVVWMNGLIPTLIAIGGIPLVIRDYTKHNRYYFLPIVLSFSMYAFMILTLQRNTPINQPDLTAATLMAPDTSLFPEFNIRYGLIMLPTIALLAAYLFRIRFRLLRIVLIGLFSIQLISYRRPVYSVIYQLPISFGGNTAQGTAKDQALALWLKAHYDGGHIMISALKHDPQMFQLGVNYATFIHEGSGKYWKESIKNPQQYATWIVFDSMNAEDQVTKRVSRSKLMRFFDLVYDVDGIRIYKIKPTVRSYGSARS